MRVWLPTRAAGFGLATAVAVLVAVVVGAVALTGGGDKNTGVGRSPSVVARMSLGEAPLDALASGFGAAWIGGIERRDVLRVDAATHRLVARIPVGDFPLGGTRATMRPTPESAPVVLEHHSTHRVFEPELVELFLEQEPELDELLGLDRGSLQQLLDGVVKGSERVHSSSPTDSTDL